MAESIIKYQTGLMREYYKYFSKYSRGKVPEKKVAWVTSFAPVELLEALDVLYYYPESYAAVIAASEGEQQLLNACSNGTLSLNCCSYSCCIEGMLELEDAPRGMMPKPDILIATNNQCNTLPGWWNMIAVKYDIPIVILDYPGETIGVKSAKDYVDKQHIELIKTLEALSGNELDESKLCEIIDNSENCVKAWKKITDYQRTKNIKPTALFDDISYLITARCKADSAKMYELMLVDIENTADYCGADIPLFWLGYPLWYHEDRYLSELLDGCRIAGANYVTWWNLNYDGKDYLERLFNAYNYTFLNLSQDSRDERLFKLIEQSGAKGVISLHNKSCKCDFVSAKNINLPQAELEIDMIDRHFLDLGRAGEQLQLLKDCICIE